MHKFQRKWSGKILAPLILFLCLGTVFLTVSKYIADVAVAACFRTLRQSTQQLGREIRRDVETDWNLLKAVAGHLSDVEKLDSAETGNLLARVHAGKMFSRLEMFFPDGRVLREDGVLVDRLDSYSFKELAAKGVHLSAREVDRNGKLFLRSYVPIEKDGVIRALLCGVIDLSRLPEFYAARDSFGQSQVYIIEGRSGNFILDTWHNVLGNNEILRTRVVKQGFDADRTIADLAAGRSGQIAFRSKTVGEDFYVDYEPVGVSDWMVMLSLPESVVFADAERIRKVLYLLAGLEAALLIAYFAWLLFKEKRKAREKAGQLNRIQYMLRVERLLFDAPRNPKLFTEALQEIAQTLTAASAFLLVFKNPAEKRLFFWSSEAWPQAGQWRRELLAERSGWLRMRLEAGESVVYDEDGARERSEEAGLLAQLGIHSFLLTPVKTADGELIGALGAVNAECRWKTAELLECVVFGFAMALRNLEAYQTIQTMGSVDSLTGLLNRNRFQKAMEVCEKTADESLTCVYVDADGLHETNNLYGHTCGDRLLQSVANALRAQFGAENTYRIGGDEFIAFCCGAEEALIRQRVRQMKAAVAADGYHVSVGIARRQGVPLVYEMVKQAEREMYEAKRDYYQSMGDRKAVREKNWELEEMLAEKRDLDVFRAVIASKYKGVYIVDLGVDTMRCIYIPPHFEKTAQEAGGKFSTALRLYVKEYVCPAYWPEFEALLEYEHVEELLARGDEPEVRYQRTDGVRLLLRLYRSPEYSAQKRQCIWSFENLCEAD